MKLGEQLDKFIDSKIAFVDDNMIPWGKTRREGLDVTESKENITFDKLKSV